MTGKIIGAFKDAGLFWQPPEAVATTIVGIQSDDSIRGKAYYIEGGDSWEIEDSLVENQPRWLSEEGTRRMRVNSEAVQKVCITSLVSLLAFRPLANCLYHWTGCFGSQSQEVSVAGYDGANRGLGSYGVDKDTARCCLQGICFPVRGI